MQEFLQVQCANYGLVLLPSSSVDVYFASSLTTFRPGPSLRQVFCS